MAKTIFGEGTVTLVVLRKSSNGKMEVAKKMRISGEADIDQHFPIRKNGLPVIGKNVYREMTMKELQAAGKPAAYKRTNYYECLVPL